MRDDSKPLNLIDELLRTEREAAHYKALSRLHMIAELTEGVVADALARLAQEKQTSNCKPGSSNRRARTALIAAQIQMKSFLSEIDRSKLELPVAELDLHMQLASMILWIATVEASVAMALLHKGAPRHRKGSKADMLAGLYKSHPDMPATRLNAMLSQPLDDATARRILRRLRKPRGGQ